MEPEQAARAPVIVVGRLQAEEVGQEDLLPLQRVHLALGAPSTKQAGAEQDACRSAGAQAGLMVVKSMSPVHTFIRQFAEHLVEAPALARTAQQACRR